MTDDASQSSFAFLDNLLESLDVKVTAVAVCKVADGWQLTVDAMPSPLIHNVLQGGGFLKTKEHCLELDGDSFVLVPAGVQHALETRVEPKYERRGLEDCTALAEGMLGLQAGTNPALVTTCGAMSATYGASLGFFDHLTKPTRVSSHFVPAVRRAFGELVEELAQPRLGTQAITSALMKQCLVLMVRSELSETEDGESWLWTLRDPRLSRAVAAMLEQPARDHSVDALAELAAMSRSAFSKRFSTALGMSPIDFLTRVRLRRAAHLLRRTRLPVKVVAASVGYSSRSYFSRRFRKRYGEDPSSFRRRHDVGDDTSAGVVAKLADFFSDD